jgi:hypothetical protein
MTRSTPTAHKPTHRSMTTDIPPEITTPASVDARLGALTLSDGAPSADTAAKIYDHLDFVHAVGVFLNAFQGPSVYAIRHGLLSIGVDDNTIPLFSELMDAQTRMARRRSISARRSPTP